MIFSTPRPVLPADVPRLRRLVEDAYADVGGHHGVIAHGDAFFLGHPDKPGRLWQVDDGAGGVFLLRLTRRGWRIVGGGGGSSIHRLAAFRALLNEWRFGPLYADVTGPLVAHLQADHRPHPSIPYTTLPNGKTRFGYPTETP